MSYVKENSSWKPGIGQIFDSIITRSKLLSIDFGSILRVSLLLQLFLSMTSATERNQVTNRFYETLGENEWANRRMLLRTMVYDYATNYIFVGAVNRVHALSFESLENVSDSYKSPPDSKPEECINSENCDADLHDYIQLLAPHKDILVVCGTARKGQCVRLFSNPLKEQTNPVGYNLASMDRFSQSFGFFNSGRKDNLVVATSYKPNDEEKVFHFIEGWNTQTSSQTTYELSPKFKNQVTVGFKGGFRYNDVIYFFSNQTRKNVVKGTYVARICSDIPDSFVEFKMVCRGDAKDPDNSLRNQEFDELLQVKFLPPVDRSDGNEETSFFDDRGMIFALFTQSHNKKASALCVYNMSSVEAATRDVIVKTVSGSLVEEKIYVSSSPSSQGQVNMMEVQKDRCTKLHHHSPISTESTIVSPTMVISLGSESVTSLAVIKDDNVMAYVGTLNGKIFKFKIKSSPRPMVELPLGHQPYPIKDLLILTKEDLFALTKKEVLKIKTFDCSGISTCRQCIADVHCGWCMSTDSCMDSPSACPVGQHYLYDKCVDHAVSPELASIANVTVFRLNVSTFPLTHEKTSCLYEDPSGRSVSVVATPEIKQSMVSCPFDWSKWKFDRSVNPVSLSLIFDETIWAKSMLTLVNCSLANSCQECTNISCFWDKDLLQCTERKPGWTSLPDSCPWVEPQTASLVPAGYSRNVSIIIRNLQSYGDVWCSFSGPVQVTPPTQVSSTNKKMGTDVNITCSQVQLNYQESIPIKSATLSLLTNVSKTTKTIITQPVQIYKCGNLAQNCGQCQSLDRSFGCLWCDGRCVYVETCKKFSGNFQSQDICTDVAVTSFQPVGGPRNGGTTITLNGRNFGTSSNGVDVVIGNSRCNNVKIETTERLTCTTSKGGHNTKFPITFKRKPSVSVNSTQLFHYMDPVISGIEPAKGLVSGATLVTLSGYNFDHGNNFQVSFVQAGHHQQLPIISRSSRELVFKTLPVSQKMPISFAFSVDGSNLPYNHQFQFLEDPIIEAFEHPFTIMHGGTPVIFKGRYFDHLNSARLVVYLPDAGNRTGAPCNVTKESRMTCPAPDISDVPNISYGESNRTKLHFGLLGCTIGRWLHLSRPDANHTRTPFKTLAYYKTPKIDNLPEVIKIKQDQTVPQYVDIRSSNNELLKRFKNLALIVCGVRVKSSVPNNPLRFELPHYFDLKNGKSHDIEVQIGNYRKPFGKVSLIPMTNLARLIGIIVGLVLGFLTIVVISYFVYRCCKLKHKTKRQTNGNLDDVNVSLPNLREVSCRGDPKAINPYSQAIPGSADEMVPLVRTPQDDENYFQNIIRAIEVLPEEGSDIYIARDKLQLGNLIGRGNFGTVYVATLKGPNESTKTVAVKTIDDPDMKEAAVENFVREGLMMKKFDHPNVMGFFGLCVGYRKEPMVILPFMTNGDLRSYVKDNLKQFTARELLKLTHQVSMGMAYLSSINFIHRDLAARNCMIDEHEVVKVADFGLSHELHEKNYYSSRDQKAKLPIKWMALESLESFIFTIKSDVWSFGVLMWEVMTRGVTPYPDVGIFETRDYLASGRRLRKPKYCPENVYDIMMRCWSEIPDQRPSFVDLVNDIEIMLNPPRKTSSSTEVNYLNQLDMQEGSSDGDYLRPF